MASQRVGVGATGAKGKPSGAGSKSNGQGGGSGSHNLNALNSFFYKATTEDDVIRDGEESAYLFDAIERIGHCECLCW